MPGNIYRSSGGTYFRHNVGTGRIESLDGGRAEAATPSDVQRLINGADEWRASEADIVPRNAPRTALSQLAPKDLPAGRYELRLLPEGRSPSNARFEDFTSVVISVANGKAVLEWPSYPTPRSIPLDFALPTSEPVFSKEGGYPQPGMLPFRTLTIAGRAQVSDGRVQFSLMSQATDGRLTTLVGVWDPKAL